MENVTYNCCTKFFLKNSSYKLTPYPNKYLDDFSVVTQTKAKNDDDKCDDW